MQIRLRGSLARVIALALATSACAGAQRTEPSTTATPAASAASTSSASPPGYTMAGTGDVHDFDFLTGAWTAHQRRLKVRGAASSEWDEFSSQLCSTSYLDSVANVDEVVFPTKGWAGLTLRAFDVAKRQWSVYWINSKTGAMFPPVVGGFTGDRGEFYGEDEDDGRHVKVRYQWTKVGPDRAHWEQAFSYDDRTWEINWTAEFSRADAASCVLGRPQPR